ncbi:MAG: trypsin-like peptidase domain-containing protein [Chitinophagaceae bacterium]
MQLKQAAAIVVLSASSAVGSMVAYNHFTHKEVYQYEAAAASTTTKPPANYAGFDGVTGAANAPLDFTLAASSTIPATVHIKTKATAKASNNIPRRSPFSDLFGGDDWGDMFDRSRSIPQQASGSGVIISEDGYIVTNNHVVDGADDITVTLSNRRSFKAKLVGVDPSSDLAVLKIEGKGLPFVLYGNSDEVKVGQWVLAVGYPLNLETTVTAGIVSAKGRTLEINRRKSETPVESFIQTDAAVNPGNSGGPLVSTEGKLIGINSAIASPTGSYAGYSFTIPVNIVKKVMADLVKFGTVQRAYLGIQYAPESMSDAQRLEQNVKDGDGIYVMDVTPEGAAFIAGIKKGDFITKINGISVSSGADMVGQIATYRPGDNVKVGYVRDGKEQVASLILKNTSGTTSVVKSSVLDKFGATLTTVDKKTATEMGIKGGVKVNSINEKGALSRTRIEEGYIIIKVNGKDVLTLDDLRKEVEKSPGEVKLEGMYSGFEDIYPYKIKLGAN